MPENETTQTRPAPLDLAALREYHGRPLRIGLSDVEPVARVSETTVHQVWPPGALARVAAADPQVAPPARRY